MTLRRAISSALLALLIALGTATPAHASTGTPVRGLGFVQGIGWTPRASGDYVGTYGVIGTTGQSRELQAFTLFGADLQIRAKIYRKGWTEPSTLGAGEPGRRLVGVQITSTDPALKAITSCHVQDVGWVTVDDGQKCGAPGSRLRVEALKVKLVRR